jgi:hypothetical protein
MHENLSTPPAQEVGRTTPGLVGVEVELTDAGTRIQLTARRQAALQRTFRRRRAMTADWPVCPLQPLEADHDADFVRVMLPLLMTAGVDGDADARQLAASFQFAAIGLVCRGAETPS